MKSQEQLNQPRETFFNKINENKSVVCPYVKRNSSIMATQLI